MRRDGRVAYVHNHTPFNIEHTDGSDGRARGFYHDVTDCHGPYRTQRQALSKAAELIDYALS